MGAAASNRDHPALHGGRQAVLQACEPPLQAVQTGDFGVCGQSARDDVIVACKKQEDRLLKRLQEAEEAVSPAAAADMKLLAAECKQHRKEITMYVAHSCPVATTLEGIAIWTNEYNAEERRF